MKNFFQLWKFMIDLKLLTVKKITQDHKYYLKKKESATQSTTQSAIQSATLACLRLSRKPDLLCWKNDQYIFVYFSNWTDTLNFLQYAESLEPVKKHVNLGRNQLSKKLQNCSSVHVNALYKVSPYTLPPFSPAGLTIT